MKKISCIKCSLNETNYISSDEDRAAAMHSGDSDDDIIVIGNELSSLTQSKELRNSFEFYFRYSGSVDE